MTRQDARRLELLGREGLRAYWRATSARGYAARRARMGKPIYRPLNCPDCGNAIEQSRTRPRLRCVACASKTGGHRGLQPIACAGTCGTTIDRGSAGQRRYCDPCRVQLNRLKNERWRRAHGGKARLVRQPKPVKPLRVPKPVRVCERCDTAFIQRSASNPGRFCSTSCAAQSRAERVRTVIGRGDRQCKACDTPFDSPRVSQKFCGKGCYRYWHGQSDPSERRPKVQDAVRRAVFEDDGWVCYLCSGDIDRDVQAPHPRSATIEHVKPWAMGGTNARENLRAAHWQCNLEKGDSLPPWWGAA